MSNNRQAQHSTPHPTSRDAALSRKQAVVNGRPGGGHMHPLAITRQDTRDAPADEPSPFPLDSIRTRGEPPTSVPAARSRTRRHHPTSGARRHHHRLSLTTAEEGPTPGRQEKQHEKRTNQAGGYACPGEKAPRPPSRPTPARLGPATHLEAGARGRSCWRHRWGPSMAQQDRPWSQTCPAPALPPTRRFKPYLPSKTPTVVQHDRYVTGSPPPLGPAAVLPPSEAPSSLVREM